MKAYTYHIQCNQSQTHILVQNLIALPLFPVECTVRKTDMADMNERTETGTSEVRVDVGRRLYKKKRQVVVESDSSGDEADGRGGGRVRPARVPFLDDSEDEEEESESESEREGRGSVVELASEEKNSTTLEAVGKERQPAASVNIPLSDPVSKEQAEDKGNGENGGAGIVDRLVHGLLTPFASMMSASKQTPSLSSSSLPDAPATAPRSESESDDIYHSGASELDSESDRTPFLTPQTEDGNAGVVGELNQHLTNDDEEVVPASRSGVEQQASSSQSDYFTDCSETNDSGCSSAQSSHRADISPALMPCLDGLGSLRIDDDDDDDDDNDTTSTKGDDNRTDEHSEKKNVPKGAAFSASKEKAKPAARVVERPAQIAAKDVRSSQPVAIALSTAPCARTLSGAKDRDGFDDATRAELSTATTASGCIIAPEIHAMMYAHQHEGLKWLWNLHTSGKAHVASKSHGYGGILADDMGMGKTLQACAFISAITRKATKASGRAKVMIIVKTSLIEPWKRELGRCHVRYDVFAGASKEQALQNVLRQGGVLLTTYGMVQHNVDLLSKVDDPHELHRWAWVVLDEGHEIKEHKSQLAQKVRRIPCTRRLLITGTPMQNNLRELWSLYDFVCPGLLGEEHHFKEHFERPIRWGVDKDANPREVNIANMASKKLRSLYEPYYLRRVKDELNSQLPNKNDIVVWLRMTPAQADLYTSFLESLSVRSARNTQLGGTNTLTAITLMKKICCSPEMVREESEAEIGKQLDTYSASDSVKVRFALGMVRRLYTEGHRTLIFSNSTRFLDIIERELQRTDLSFLRIDGSVSSSKERQNRVDSFNADAGIATFLLTTKAGGVGITLTGADRVIMMDPSWNPTVDNQAVDRVYRIGQTRDVIVYRLVTVGTVEEKQYQRQIFKGGLSRTSSMEDDQYRYFSSTELSDLFSFSKESIRESETQKKLAELHTHERKYTKVLESELERVQSDASVAGVSDHDLLYSKEAQKEYGRGVKDDTTMRFSSTPRKSKYGGRRYASSSNTRVAGPVWNGGRSHSNTTILSSSASAAALSQSADVALGCRPSLLQQAQRALTPGKIAAARRKVLDDRYKNTAAAPSLSHGSNESVTAKAKEGVPLQADIDALVARIRYTRIAAEKHERLLQDKQLIAHTKDKGARVHENLRLAREHEENLTKKLKEMMGNA